MEELPEPPKEEGDEDVDHIDYSKMVLKDGILNINTGFPIIIALNKSDILNFGEA